MPSPLSLSLTGLDWVVCLGTLVASIAYGLWVSVRAKSSANSAGFFLAGRSLTWPIVGLSLYATNIGAEHLVGLSGDSYRYGVKASTVEVTTAICLGLSCWLLFPTYLKNRIFTIPEYLERRYDVRARLFFSGLMLVVCVMTKMAFTLFAGAMVMNSLLGWDVMTVVWVIAAIVAVATIIGGFAAVAYTDAIQACIIIVGCTAMLFLGLDKVGGWGELLARASQKMHVAGPLDDPNYPFWGIIAGAIYGGIFYWGMDQVNVQRVLGARDLRQGRLGAMFAILLKLTPIFIFAVPGVIAYALYPHALTEQQSRSTFVLLLNNLLPSGLRGLVLSALLAALISSLLSVMNSVATLTVRDFVMFRKPDLGERTQVFLGRVFVVAFSLLGVLASYLVYRTQEGLYKYLQTISVYLVMPLTPAIFFGVVNKRINMKGAIACVLTGVVISAIYVTDALFPEFGRAHFALLHHTMTENYTYRGLWATLIITAVLFAVSYATAPPTPEQQSVTYDWRRKPEPFQGLNDWRLHLATLSCVTVLVYRWLW